MKYYLADIDIFSWCWISISLGFFYFHARQFCTAMRFFKKQRFLSTQPQCWLTFSCIQLQMQLRCCLINITIIILRLILYSVYLCLSQFISYLCDLFFILSVIAVNFITSLQQRHLLFVHFLEFLLLFLDENMNEESE